MPARLILSALPLLLFVAVSPIEAAQSGAPLCRVLLPSLSSSQLSSEKALNRLIEEHNQTPGAEPRPIEILRRGTDFSSLKELTVAAMAGTTPDLAAIEASEMPALEAAHIALPRVQDRIKPLVRGMDPDLLKSGQNSKGEQVAIPFERALPLLLIDQEMLFRIRAKPEHSRPAWLSRWAEIEALSKRFNQYFQNTHSEAIPLEIPLLGARGLWIFEALSAHPLWKRETGGLRSNRELLPSIDRLRAWSTGSDRIARTDLTWERATQDFIDRRSPLVVSSTDALPLLRSQAGFRWTAIPLPTLEDQPSRLATGTNLVVLRDTPAVWALIQDLFRPDQAARWLQTGGYAPLNPEWATALKSSPLQNDLGMGDWTLPAGPWKIRGSRSMDPEMIRARSSWIQGLIAMFGETAMRRTPSEVLTSLDRQINSGIQE